VIRPTAVEIQQMEAAFEWLRELRDLDSGMALVTTLWSLRSVRGRSIKKLCEEKQWAPHTFFRKRTKALKRWRRCSTGAACRYFDRNLGFFWNRPVGLLGSNSSLWRREPQIAAPNNHPQLHF
jgi:hypothetical protein